jgi:acetyltransferase-like isoleucine patch superfamily enzyme
MFLKNVLLRILSIKGRNVTIGNKFHIGPFSRIYAPYSLRIGHHVYVGKHVTIEVDGTIGNGVLIANSVGIIGRHDHDINDVGSPISSAKWVGAHEYLKSPVEIGSDVWIGFGAIILAPVKIGHSAIIGAGSVITKDVTPYSIMVGNPAIKIGERIPDKSKRLLHEQSLIRLEYL